MFQFPAFAPAVNHRGWPYSIRPGCPIRKPGGQGPLAPHPGLSQLAASFIALRSLGIHLCALILLAPRPVDLPTGPHTSRL